MEPTLSKPTAVLVQRRRSLSNSHARGLQSVSIDGDLNRPKDAFRVDDLTRPYNRLASPFTSASRFDQYWRFQPSQLHELPYTNLSLGLCWVSRNTFSRSIADVQGHSCQVGGRGVRWRSNDGTGAQQEMDGSRVDLSELVGVVEMEQDKAEIATKAKVE